MQLVMSQNTSKTFILNKPKSFIHLFQKKIRVTTFSKHQSRVKNSQYGKSLRGMQCSQAETFHLELEVPKNIFKHKP